MEAAAESLAPDSEECRAWLALARVPRLTAPAALALVARFESAAALLRASRTALRAAGLTDEGLSALEGYDGAAVNRDQTWLVSSGNRLVTVADAAYPQLLQHIADPPIVLFVRGAIRVLSEPMVAIVGSRHATPTGREIAYELARDLVNSGFVVASGLAIGIDTAAHEGALAAGATIAVAGTGLDRVYPRQNRTLAERIANAGALVSEFTPGVPPLAANFPRRNRIVVGVSLGLVVVEAARRSGSLISARLAADQGREVFVVPGSIRSPTSHGCHALLRDGATLVESVEDILDELIPGRAARLEPHRVGSDRNPDHLDARSRSVWNSLDVYPSSMDDLVRRSGLTASDLSSILCALELNGLVMSHPGGRYSRRSSRR